MKSYTDDAALIAGICSHDMDAMSTLYDRLAPRVFGVAARILRDVSEAQEVVQDVFLQAWRERDRYDVSRGSVTSWLMMMARSRALDRLRATRAARARLTGDLSSLTDAVLALDDHDAVEALSVRECVKGLPALQRVALELAFFQGYSYAEVADRLKQPVGTIKSRIRVALARLRDAVEHGPSRFPAEIGETPFTVALADFLARHPAMPFDFEVLDGIIALIVDDDRETCDLVTTVLESAGASVDRCTSSQDALDRLTVRWPDVLIADIRMPGEDGYSFIKKARSLAESSRRCLRAAAFTALGSEQDRAAAKQAGYTLHLTKPIHPHEIVRTVAILASRAA